MDDARGIQAVIGNGLLAILIDAPGRVKGSVASVACTRDSIDCDLVCSIDWMGKVSGPVIRPASMRKNVTASGRAERWTMIAVS